MRRAAIILIVILIGASVFFATQDPPVSPALAQSNAIANDLTSRTTSGDVVGFIGDDGARSWLGIPFARPPVGNLRWRAPLPPEPWDEARVAKQVGDLCPQLNPATVSDEVSATAAVVGSEDCLYLNVYAPAIASNRPVMFWIHGGGNSVGDGGSYNASRLAVSQDVVVITINYRLAHLGWFSHPALATGQPLDDSGNYGTLDIIRALEWTRDNAAGFGGDPDNVTVFGESAGASDTMTMVASPLARGLFHRGIVQSGGLRISPVEFVQGYASQGGHPYSSREIVSHLLIADGLASDAVTAQTYQDAMTADELRVYLYRKTPEELFAPFDNSNFGMIPTPEVFADGHVLPAISTEEILSNPDNHNSVPMILGTNRDEPSLFMFADPRYLDLSSDVPRLKDQARYLRQVKYGALSSKRRGVDSLATYMTAAGNRDVYAYRFDWDEEGVVDGRDLSVALGAGHALEIPFVFGDFETGLPLGEFFQNSPEKELLAGSMMSYWSQFAATGNPGRGQSGDGVEWLAWDADASTTLVLDTPSDQGIYMTDGVVSAASIKAELAADPEIADALERCTHYSRIFGYSRHFDTDEYADFGPDGCAQFDPAEIRGF